MYIVLYNGSVEDFFRYTSVFGNLRQSYPEMEYSYDAAYFEYWGDLHNYTLIDI
jgi:hypothetical protein